MSGINLVGEQIKPLKVLVHKEIKTLWEDIVRAKSNGQTINRESLLKSVEFMISDQLIAHEIWNKEWEEINDDGEPVLDSNGNPTLISHWNTWTDDKLFSNLLQIISEDGVLFGMETELHEKIAKRIQSLGFLNIEEFRPLDLSRYMTKFDDSTTKMGDVDELTSEQLRAILKIAIQNLTVDRDSIMGRNVSKVIRTDLEQALSSMTSFDDYRIKLTKIWTTAKSHIMHAKQYGMVAPINNKPENKNGNGKRTQNNSGYDKKSNKKQITEQTPSHDKCTACGRSSHITSECKLVHFHPNVNKNKDMAFADTEQGKACLSVFGKAELPFRKTIDNKDVDVPEQYLPKGNKKHKGIHFDSNLNTITSIDNNEYPIITCDLIMYKRSEPSQRVNISCPLVLIDSGALDANYIDENFVNDLVHMYNISINKRNIVKISSALKDLTTYKTSKGTLVLELIVYNEQTNTNETIKCSFRIVNLSKFNIILGIHTIKQYDLTLKYRSLFSTNTITNNITEREHSTANDDEAVGEEYKRKISYLTSSFSPNSAQTYMESTELVGSVAQGLNHIHVRDLLGESDEPDDLQLQQENDNVTTMTSQWDIYSEESTNPHLHVENEIESNIPTNIHFAKERHIMLFNKYASIFSRTVNSEPAAVPPMTLQVDTTKWESRQHRLAPRYQSTIKHEEIKKQMKSMANLKVIQPSQATEWSQVTIAPKPNGK